MVKKHTKLQTIRDAMTKATAKFTSGGGRNLKRKPVTLAKMEKANATRK
jgi:hypothetical protein